MVKSAITNILKANLGYSVTEWKVQVQKSRRALVVCAILFGALIHFMAPSAMAEESVSPPLDSYQVKDIFVPMDSADPDSVLLGSFTYLTRVVKKPSAFITEMRNAIAWRSPEDVFYEIAIPESRFFMSNLNDHSLNMNWLGVNNFDLTVPTSLRDRLGSRVTINIDEVEGSELKVRIYPPAMKGFPKTLKFKRDPSKFKETREVLGYRPYVPSSHPVEPKKDLMVFVRQLSANEGGVDGSIQGLIVERPQQFYMADGVDQNQAILFSAKIVAGEISSFEVDQIFKNPKLSSDRSKLLMSSHAFSDQAATNVHKTLMTDPDLRQLAFFNIPIENDVAGVGRLMNSKREHFSVYSFRDEDGYNDHEKFKVVRADEYVARIVSSQYASWRIHLLASNPVQDPFFRMLVGHAIPEDCGEELAGY